jgi:hypothetical protein
MRLAFMAAVIALSTPAFATTGDNSQVPNTSADAVQQPSQNATADAQVDRKICRRIDATESRLAAKKLCLTAEQWKQRDQNSAQF